MTTRAAMISLLLISGLVSGCALKVSPTAKQTAQEGKIDIDDEIFDAVLSDLINYQDFAPAVGDLTKKCEIVLSERTYGGLSKRFLDNGCVDRINAIPSEIRIDLVKRNPRDMRWTIAH